jgi:glyoxylase-like metal-dependent hydrolase (beta-lactamase superfamily II)
MLRIQTFTFNPFQENTYIVFLDSGACMIVDPGCFNREEEAELENFIAENGLKPKLLVNTHCHIDHVLGNAFVGKKYGLKPYFHPKEQAVMDAVEMVAGMYGVPYTPSPEGTYFDGDHIFLEDERFDLLFVPGHSPGHVALYHAISGNLLAGDTLFYESVGRTDLPGGHTETLLNSIRKELFILPEATVVYSGHMQPTTIGHEKKHNPFLK